MKQLTKSSLVFLLSLFAFLTSISPALAAPSQSVAQKTMKVEITIIGPNTFWTYPYINRQSGEILQPSLVQVEWSIGELGKNLTKTTIVNQGKATGELGIITDKDALVNLRIIVCDSKGNIIGSSNALEYNRGQTKAFTISAPESTEPAIMVN